MPYLLLRYIIDHQDESQRQITIIELVAGGYFRRSSRFLLFQLSVSSDLVQCRVPRDTARMAGFQPTTARSRLNPKKRNITLDYEVDNTILGTGPSEWKCFAVQIKDL